MSHWRYAQHAHGYRAKRRSRERNRPTARPPGQHEVSVACKRSRCARPPNQINSVFQASLVAFDVHSIHECR